MIRRAGWLTAACIAAALLIGVAIGAQSPMGAEDKAFDRRVRAYLTAHPEVMVEVADRLRLRPYLAAMRTPFAGAWAGNPQGDVTIVLFTDYACPYCRASAPDVERLIAGDPKLKVVWRELPVLGPQSATAALAALAAARRDRYSAFHQALFAGNHPDHRSIVAAWRAAGLDPASLPAAIKAPELQAEIGNNLALARALQIGATPFFAIGDHVVEGAAGYDALKAAVAHARATAGG